MRRAAPIGRKPPSFSMPLTLASRRPLRILATVWAAVLVAGAAFTTELREWRRATGGRGAATLRLTFQDGRRVTIYPGAYRHADELQRQLEELLPGEGGRVRVGRTVRA